MLLVLLFLCSFCLGGVLSPFGVQDGETYVWPQDEKFPKEMGYFRSGQVVYTQYRERYADGTGVYQDAPCWNIYIRGAQYPRRHQLHQPAEAVRVLLSEPERRRRTSFFL